MRLFYDDSDIRSVLKTIIRCGKVSSVDCSRCTARVTFPDDDDVVSFDLPVLQRNALDNRDYAMPDIGESVLCVFLPIGNMSAGFVVGSFYSMDVLRPEATGDKRTVVFDDGTRVSYDRELHHLSVEIEETKITANRKMVTIDTPLDVAITAGNDVSVKAHKLHVDGMLGTTAGATGVITGGSVVSVVNGIVTAIN